MPRMQALALVSLAARLSVLCVKWQTLCLVMLLPSGSVFRACFTVSQCRGGSDAVRL
ncbi:hypothetical protein WA016_06359 [Myxococcus stipitatus]